MVFCLLLTIGWGVESCNNNNEQTPAKAGTADTSGTGHAVGTGTPYGGDSVTNKMTDTSSRK